MPHSVVGASDVTLTGLRSHQLWLPEITVVDQQARKERFVEFSSEPMEDVVI
jgi:hypothetical protein